MSAYNQVPRLTTTNPLKMHHRHLGHQHGCRDTGPPLMAAPVDEHEAANYRGGGEGGAQQTISSQRKWRVLVSIGLLLPALAAIIGIVAWTISIEVANDGADQMTAASAMAQLRRAERAQKQQQFRRDEAAALAAVIVARRPRVSPAQPGQGVSNQEQPPMSAPLIQQAQQQDQIAQQISHSSDKNTNNEKDDDEKQPRPAAARHTRTSQRPAGAPMSSTQPPPRQQQQQAKRQAAAAKISESSLLLTNMDQVQALTNSGQDPFTLEGSEPSAHSKLKRQEKKASETNSNKDGKELANTTANQRENESPAVQGFQDRDDEMMNVADDSSIDTEPVSKAVSSSEQANDSSETTSDANQKQQREQTSERVVPVEQQKLSHEEEFEKEDTSSEINKDHRSRWMSESQMGANKKSKPSETVVTNRKLATAKQNYYKKHEHRPVGTKGGVARAKSNIEYRMLASSVPASSNEDESRQDQPVKSEQDSSFEMQNSDNKRDCAPGTEAAARRSQQTEASAGIESRPGDSNQDEVSFEAIASAISKSLSDNQPGGGEQVAPVEPNDNKDKDGPARAMAELLSGAIASNNSADSGSVAVSRASSSLEEEDEQEGVEESTPDKEIVLSVEPSGADSRMSKRRRTTGEHLAEVIDHIVEKRHHQRLARFGERSSAADLQHQEGPQIVVVAPVGPSGAFLKARSLTKEQNTTKISTQTAQNKPERKPESKSESKSSLVGKKQIEPVKKKQKQTRIGGRLLGIDDAGQSASSSQPKGEPKMKYSERVEVIEDDDSSALLLSQPLVNVLRGDRPVDGGEINEEDLSDEQEERDSTATNSQQKLGQADLATFDHEQLSSIHVSSHSNEPRSRLPRYESSQMFERYAPMPQQQQQQPPPPQQHQNQQHKQQKSQRSIHMRPASQEQQQKLYSAEQLIMEHVLKSQARSIKEQQQQAPQTMQQSNKQQNPVAKQIQDAISTTSPSSTTTPVPHPTTAGHSSPSESAQVQQQQQPNGLPSSRTHQEQRQQSPEQAMLPSIDRTTGETRSNNQPYQNMEQRQTHQDAYESMQPVQVPAILIQQSKRMHQYQHPNQHQNQHRPQQQSHNLQDPYQTMESQQTQVQMARPSSYEPADQMGSAVPAQQAANPVADGREQAPQPQHQQMNHQHDQFHHQHQHQQAQQLPVFADQEIQVPAHMAESVIRDLQQAPSTVTGMLNGQPALFQAQPTMMAQVPQQTPHHHQNQHLGEQQMMQQQQQQQYNRFRHQMNLAESHQRPMFMTSQQQPQHQQQPQQHQQSYLRQALGASSYSPLGLMSRFASARRQQEQQLQQQEQIQRDRQVLASRASAAKDDTKQQQQQEGSLMDSVKALGPKGLIQPVAQMALKNLLSSLGQQAAAQQAQADAAEQYRNQQRSSPAATAAAAIASVSPQADSILAPVEPIQSSGSGPVGVMAATPPESATGRSMRSLPIGAQAPLSQQQLQPIGSDQEVQESYGQMPTYHMPGGGNYAPDNYQGEHDKKTKGITFHFGGGPIGGGTQLITSPMGIFKHLMIPLLPNPRVNLNGKVVFGVVLEKSTAFGPPPKKKHKFWG